MNPVVLVLVIVCFFLIFGAYPGFTGHIHGMGWGPSGIGVVLFIVLLVLLMRG